MGLTTFSASSKRTITKRHKRGEYLPVRTGFLTNEGPAQGTMWVFVDDAAKECWEVEEVELENFRYANGSRSGMVKFVDRGSRTLASFMGDVQIGKLILVGVMPLHLCRTEI